MKNYTELMKLNSFDERLEYLKCDSKVGDETFGSDRYINQVLYKSYEWRKFRDTIILRDEGCDLACSDRPVGSWTDKKGKRHNQKIIIHHINPLTKDDINNRSSLIFDPENVICVTMDTHNRIHYGDNKKQYPNQNERYPGDTTIWKEDNKSE